MYGHSQVTDRVLVDSGWHCSFCFRTLGEFGDKMTGASPFSPFQRWWLILILGSDAQDTRIPTDWARLQRNCSTRSTFSRSFATVGTSLTCGARPTECVPPSFWPPHSAMLTCLTSSRCQQWKDFVALLSLDRSLSAVGLPRRLIEQGRERFDFLLPGGCVREDRV